jgi:UDP-MurNAc hydroxylase
VSSYHFYPFTDSAAVVECDGTTLLNANDAKFMGAPLEQILERHRPIDFVFRSHSPANDRICFDYLDEPCRRREESGGYLRDFSDFVNRTGARYAIPFASNHCYLHRETFHLNDTIITPAQVEAHCRSIGLVRPEVKAMVCGDSWSSETGFSIARENSFADRERKLAEYAERQSGSLEKFYDLEARTETSLAQVEGYFRTFIAALPWFVRRFYKDRQITWVLTGRRTSRFWLDIHRGLVRELAGLDDEAHPLQIHTSAYIMRRCMAQNLFLYLGIGKRVLFRSRKEDAKYLRLLILLFNLYECEMLPWRKLLAPRFLAAWLPRWRELGLYAVILLRLMMGKPFVMGDYLRTAARKRCGASGVRRFRRSMDFAQKRV